MWERQKPNGRVPEDGQQVRYWLFSASFVEQHELTPALESRGHKQDMRYDLEV